MGMKCDSHLYCVNICMHSLTLPYLLPHLQEATALIHHISKSVALPAMSSKLPASHDAKGSADGQDEWLLPSRILGALTGAKAPSHGGPPQDGVEAMIVQRSASETAARLGAEAPGSAGDALLAADLLDSVSALLLQNVAASSSNPFEAADRLDFPHPDRLDHTRAAAAASPPPSEQAQQLMQHVQRQMNRSSVHQPGASSLAGLRRLFGVAPLLQQAHHGGPPHLQHLSAGAEVMEAEGRPSRGGAGGGRRSTSEGGGPLSAEASSPSEGGHPEVQGESKTSGASRGGASGSRSAPWLEQTQRRAISLKGPTRVASAQKPVPLQPPPPPPSDGRAARLPAHTRVPSSKSRRSSVSSVSSAELLQMTAAAARSRRASVSSSASWLNMAAGLGTAPSSLRGSSSGFPPSYLLSGHQSAGGSGFLAGRSRRASQLSDRATVASRTSSTTDAMLVLPPPPHQVRRNSLGPMTAGQQQQQQQQLQVGAAGLEAAAAQVAYLRNMLNAQGRG